MKNVEEGAEGEQKLSKAEKAEKEMKANLGPALGANELFFGVCHILATFNDTFIHVTDLTGRETYVRVTGTIPQNLS